MDMDLAAYIQRRKMAEQQVAVWHQAHDTNPTTGTRWGSYYHQGFPPVPVPPPVSG